MVQAWWPGNTKTKSLLRNQFNVPFINQQRHFSALCVNFSSPVKLFRHSTKSKMCRLRSAAMDSSGHDTSPKQYFKLSRIATRGVQVITVCRQSWDGQHMVHSKYLVCTLIANIKLIHRQFFKMVSKWFSLKQILSSCHLSHLPCNSLWKVAKLHISIYNASQRHNYVNEQHTCLFIYVYASVFLWYVYIDG